MLYTKKICTAPVFADTQVDTVTYIKQSGVLISCLLTNYALDNHSQSLF